jgi:hypothetical protein
MNFCMATFQFLMFEMKSLDGNLISLQLAICFLSKRAQSKETSLRRYNSLHRYLPRENKSTTMFNSKHASFFFYFLFPPVSLSSS